MLPSLYLCEKYSALSAALKRGKYHPICNALKKGKYLEILESLKRVDFCSGLYYNNNIHYTSFVLFYLCVKEFSAIRYLPPDCVRAFSFYLQGNAQNGTETILRLQTTTDTRKE